MQRCLLWILQHSSTSSGPSVQWLQVVEMHDMDCTAKYTFQPR